MLNEIHDIYTFFNILSLFFSLITFLLNYFLDLYQNNSNNLLSLNIALQISLITFSILHYVLYNRFSSPSINSKLTFLIMNILYELCPFFEILIGINLEVPFYIYQADFYWVYHLKLVYFLLKSLMLSILTKKSISKALLMNSLYFLMIIINLCVVLHMNDSRLLIILFFKYLLLVFSIASFLKLNQLALSNETTLYKAYLEQMDEPMAIIAEGSISKSYKLLFHNNKIPLLYNSYANNSKTPQKALSFNDLSKMLSNFSFNKAKHSDVLISEERTVSPINVSFCHLLYNSLIEMISFYTSFKDNKVIISFLYQNDNNNTTIKEDTITPLNLKLTLKKAIINKRAYFFLQIKKIKKILNIIKDNEFKTRLLNSISHELKTPLNGSLVLLELLRDDIIKEEQSSNIYLDNSLASLKILENTLNNIIDYSLITSQQMLICMSSVNIMSLMNEVFIITRSQAELKNLNYTIEIQGIFTHKSIYTDHNRLKQILLNIILNSLQFTNEGFIKVLIQVTSEEPLTIGFSIKDSGIGMNKTLFESLLTKLQDDSYEFKGNSTGSGMGLTISHKLAFLLGKTGLLIETNDKEGSLVQFDINDNNKNFTEIKSNKNHLENIIISNKWKKLNSIIDSSKRIEFIRQKNKSLRKKPSCDNSEQDSIEDGTLNTYNFNRKSKFFKIHNFDEIKKARFWIDDIIPDNNKNNNKHNYSINNLDFNELQPKSYSACLKKKRKTNILSNDNENSCSLDDLSEINDYKNNNTDNTKNFFLTSLSRLTSHDTKNEKSTNKNQNCLCDCEDILIVDDDIFNLLSLELILKSLKKPCLKASNGKEALQMIKSQRCQSIHCHGFRLVLMDYQMPIMDGVAATYEIMKMKKKIKEEKEKEKENEKEKEEEEENEEDEGQEKEKEKEKEKRVSIPIVIGCTAFTTKNEVAKCLDIGMKDVIFKPLSKEIVGRVLREWIND